MRSVYFRRRVYSFLCSVSWLHGELEKPCANMAITRCWWGCLSISLEIRQDLVPGKHLFSSYSVSRFCKEPRLVVWPSTKLWQQFISIETALFKEIGSFSLKCHWYRSCHSYLGHPKEISVCFQGDFRGFLFTNDVPWLPLSFGSLSQS